MVSSKASSHSGNHDADEGEAEERQSGMLRTNRARLKILRKVLFEIVAFKVGRGGEQDFV